MLKRTGTFLVYIWRGNVSKLRPSGRHSAQLNDRKSFKTCLSCQIALVLVAGRRLWGGRNAFSYRVEDFVKVDETDGDADDLEEDGCEGDEPQTLQRSRGGHGTSVDADPGAPSSKKTRPAGRTSPFKLCCFGGREGGRGGERRGTREGGVKKGEGGGHGRAASMERQVRRGSLIN